MSRPELPPAPPSPVGPGGEIALGAYLGHTGPIDWSRAGRSAPWRALHWKRWHYVSIAGPAFVAAVAIVDVG